MFIDVVRFRSEVIIVVRRQSNSKWDRHFIAAFSGNETIKIAAGDEGHGFVALDLLGDGF